MPILASIADPDVEFAVDVAELRLVVPPADPGHSRGEIARPDRPSTETA